MPVNSDSCMVISTTTDYDTGSATSLSWSTILAARWRD